MKYAIVENGVVVNIAVSDTALADNWVEASGAEIGDVWDGQSFSKPVKTPEKIEAETLATRQGMTVERWSFATAAMVAGILTAEEAQAWGPGTSLPAAVDQAITAAVSDPVQLAGAKVRALSAPRINRLNPLVEILRGAFQLTEEQADDLFTTAKQIEAA